MATRSKSSPRKATQSKSRTLRRDPQDVLIRNVIGVLALAFFGLFVVRPAIERAAQRDCRLDVKLAVPPKPAYVAPTRQKNVEDCVRWGDVKLIIRRFVDGWFQEQFKDVVLPRVAVMLGHRGVQVGVIEVGCDVEARSVPEETGSRCFEC